MVDWLALLGMGGIAAGVLKRRQQRREAQAQRKHLLAVLQRFRYFKLLKFVHVDVERYLDVLPEETLRSHLERCERCQATDACDACLRDGHRIDDLHFCPNYDELTAESRLMQRP